MYREGSRTKGGRIDDVCFSRSNGLFDSISLLNVESAVDGREGSGRLRSKSISDIRLGEPGAEGAKLLNPCVGTLIGSVG